MPPTMRTFKQNSTIRDTLPIQICKGNSTLGGVPCGASHGLNGRHWESSVDLACQLTRLSKRICITPFMRGEKRAAAIRLTNSREMNKRRVADNADRQRSNGYRFGRETVMLRNLRPPVWSPWM